MLFREGPVKKKTPCILAYFGSKCGHLSASPHLPPPTGSLPASNLSPRNPLVSQLDTGTHMEKTSTFPFQQSEHCNSAKSFDSSVNGWNFICNTLYSIKFFSELNQHYWPLASHFRLLRWRFKCRSEWLWEGWAWWAWAWAWRGGWAPTNIVSVSLSSSCQRYKVGQIKRMEVMRMLCSDNITQAML